MLALPALPALAREPIQGSLYPHSSELSRREGPPGQRSLADAEELQRLREAQRLHFDIDEAEAATISEEVERVLRDAANETGRPMPRACDAEPGVFEQWHVFEQSRPRLLLTLAPWPEHGSTALLQMVMSSPHVASMPA